MPGRVLSSKITVPRLRHGVVPRVRLSDRLGGATNSALTLLSAPAGFGKTTLLTEWLAGQADTGRAVAWLSLDARDNDQTLFWTYVISAIRVPWPDIGAEALALLQPPQSPIDVVLSSLLNDLDLQSAELVLILDDYHVIEADDIREGVAFLVEHLPAQVHLVIASRTDPALPLPNLRARRDLLEFRASDLRFTPDEAATYLTDEMGLTLTSDDITTLEQRTEGWIAALQMAALSMQGREDVAAFIASFAGDDRYIVDYLADEVLRRQPEHVRNFLLQTSILDRLSGPLCDAITGQVGGRSTLTQLERGNLFLVPLDDRREWYRYHHLFADVLRAHLLDEQPERIADLHRRASHWYADNSDVSEAISHALKGHAFERAADLVETAIPEMRKSRQEARVYEWLHAVPPAVVRDRPVLVVAYAGSMLSIGQLEGVEPWLDLADELLAAEGASHIRAGARPSTPVHEDDEEWRRLPAMVASYRAAVALSRSDIAGTVRNAQHALEVAAPDDHLSRAAAAGLLGLAYWASGDLEKALSSYTNSIAGLHAAGHTADTLGITIAAASIQLTQGRLTDALSMYERALELAPARDGVVLRGTADMHVGISEVLLERGDLTGATKSLAYSQELGEQAGLPQNRYRSRVAQARLRAAEGDVPAALSLLDDAERVYVSDFFPNVRPISALRARMQATHGHVTDALAWAHASGLSVDDDLYYMREFEHVTLAAVLLAASSEANSAVGLPAVGAFLQRLADAADAGGRSGSLVEIRVLAALCHQRQGDAEHALEALRQAVTLAEPEGHVRVFREAGPDVASLLKHLRRETPNSSFLSRLHAPSSSADPVPKPSEVLLEPLSQRELDVLRLLSTDLEGPDIARQLFISLNTLRTHTQRIYTKLGVNNRRAAVRRAQELNLLDGAR